MPDEPERRWVEPALLALLGVGGTTTASEQLFAAWRTFFERLAAAAPVVMVFEDFHYADAGLLDFVDHLLEWSRNHPIFVLTLARPELLERRPDWGAGKRSFTSVHLEPLTPSEMRQLLAGLVPGLPDAAARAIVERADGIPLYAIETVRMLVADGRLTARDDAYVPTGDLTELAVPESLAALIASRLDGLAPEDRTLVQDAATLGQSFTLAAVAAVAGRPEVDVEPHLRSLVRREILALEADPRSPERGQYAFVQALIREVAYRTLARGDRKARHLAAARFFEALGSDELAGALAGHYLAAYRSAPDGPEAEALGAQARVALRAAADRAVRLGSHEQAVAFIEQALAVTDDPAERAGLMLRAARSAAAALKFASAERYYQEAIELGRRVGDRESVARATAALGRQMLISGRVDEALALLEDAVRPWDDPTGSHEIGVAAESAAGVALMSALAQACAMSGHSDRAVAWVERLLPIAERLDLVEEIASGWLSRLRGLTDRSREGQALVRAALDLATTYGLTDVDVRARTILTFQEVGLDPRSGLAAARTGLENARRQGSRLYAISMVGNGVDCAFRTGEWDWAIATLREWLDSDLEPSYHIELTTDLARFLACRGEEVDALLAEIEPLVGQVSDRQYAAYRSLSHAWQRLAAGDLVPVRDAVASALAGSPFFVTVGHPLAARAALWAHDLDGARETLTALDGSGNHGIAVDADRVTLRAGIRALEGSTAEAMALYREALQRWRDAGLPWDEALCAIDMTELIGPGEAEVVAAAEVARDILARLGARPFLARLDTATARGDGAAPFATVAGD